MSSEIDQIELLEKLIAKHGMIPGPTFHHKDRWVLYSAIEFEPHGRASETWEGIYKLYLPEFPYYWKSTTGWREGEGLKGMMFKGRTAMECFYRATTFLRETYMEHGALLKEQDEKSKPE
jgi:hypothetical protein